MKTELVDTSQTLKEIKIEIEADVVRGAYDQVIARYSQQANVPGFRKGHTPKSVIRTRFKNEIKGDVLRDLVPEAVSTAVQELGLLVIGEPDIHLDDEAATDKFGDGPLKIHAHVEVIPEIHLNEYKGLDAVRRVRPINDEDVDRLIQGLREQSASLQPIEDRGAETGDTVSVNFEGTFIDEPDAEHIKVDDVEIELGSANVQPEFTENLLGARADDQKTFTVSYPEDFSSKGLAGKKVEYIAQVAAVRRKELPELDDDFARSLGEEFESVEALRDKVREDLNARVSAEANDVVRKQIIEKLIENHPIEVPKTLVEHQTNQLLQSAVRDLLGRGVDPREHDFDWQKVRDELGARAEFDVRTSLLLEAVADAENLEVSDDEIQNEIAALALESRKSEAEVRAALTKQGGERSIADRLRNRKAIELLVENAHVTDAEWVPAEPVEVTTAKPEEPAPVSAEKEPKSASAEADNA
jgi:trigger factor